MALNRQSLNVTELDFDQIKANLIGWLSDADSPFRDWNFAGSGLNKLADVLAYNTHYNALQAHFAVSEGFMDSAQLRSSVVSLGKLLGYTPRSYAAATAVISLSFLPKDINKNSIILPKGTTFVSSLNDNRQTFVTDNEHILRLNSNNEYSISRIKIKQGFYQTKRFQINNISQSKIISYEIDDTNIDLSTLVVRIYPSASSSVSDVYTKIEEISGVNENTKIYFISENANGNYQISFGNDVIGAKPNNLNVVELTYLVTDGPSANNVSSFSFVDTLPDGVLRAPTIITDEESIGGNINEGIESIRYNAPLSFISQNRAVTPDDYKNLIFQKFSEAETISVWGGEDNEPPEYGKVFISVKPKGANVLTPSQKVNILSYLKTKKVVSIFPQLVDPQYLSLTLDVLFKYNKNLLLSNTGQLENGIRNVVKDYNDIRLQSFNGIFRYSSLTSAIDNYSSAVLNSHVRVFVSKKVILNPNDVNKKTIEFSTPLIPDDGHVIISCSPFKVNGIEVFINDEEIIGDQYNRNLYTYYYKNAIKTKLDANVGTLNIETGLMMLNEIYPDEYTEIMIDLIPASNDIAPKRNQLLQIDMNRLFVRGDVDIVAIGGSSRTIDYTTFKRDR